MNNKGENVAIAPAAFLVLIFMAVNFCCAQGTLEFNQAKIISAVQESVPSGKVWKVTSVYGTTQQCYEIGPCYTALSPKSYGFANASGLIVNGVTISSRFLWKRVSFYSDATCTNDPRNFSMTDNNCTCGLQATDQNSDPNLLPMWLPAGTTVKSLGTTSFISIIEFNIVP